MSILILVILIGFFIKWQLSKAGRSAADFYAGSKMVKHTVIIGVGVVFLALAFVVDFLNSLYTLETFLVVLRHLFGLIALICFGYGYYKEIRQSR